MRKAAAFLLVCVLFLLCGCSEAEEISSVDGDVRVGSLFTVRAPEDFTLSESNDVLSMQGIYYLTWVTGESRTITNDEDEDAEVYDCQVYLLVTECSGSEKAAETAEGWREKEAESYSAEIAGDSGSGFDCSCLRLTPLKENSPFSSGASAFFTVDSNAVCVEVFCADGYSEDCVTVLREFLAGITAAEQED